MGVGDQLVVLQAATLIAEGLWNAHAQMTVMHRDLKPNNILVERDKMTGVVNVALIDFGFAKDTSAVGEFVGSQAIESTATPYKKPIQYCKHHVVPDARVRMRILKINLIFGDHALTSLLCLCCYYLDLTLAV